jgi:hypothetical protein
VRPQLPDGYAVEYRYEPVMTKRPPRGSDDCVETLRTRALVGRENRSFAEFEGEAILNPGDVFSIQLGRDIALGRALKNLRETKRFLMVDAQIPLSLDEIERIRRRWSGEHSGARS